MEPLRFRRAPLLFAAIAFALGESLTKLPHPVPRPTILLVAASIALAAGLHFAGHDGLVGPVAGFVYPLVIMSAIWFSKRRAGRALRALGDEG